MSKNIDISIVDDVPSKLVFDKTSVYTANGSAYLCTLPDGEKIITRDIWLAKHIAESGGVWIEYAYFPSC